MEHTVGSGYLKNEKKMQSKEALKIDRQWFCIRDLFFGWNYLEKDAIYAISLAKTCPHVDAQWLYNTFQSCKTNDDIRRILALLRCGRGLIFSACFSDPHQRNDLHLVDLASLHKNPLALALKAKSGLSAVTSKEYAEMAVVQGEREGYYQLYWCLKFYFSDQDAALPFLEKCANLNKVAAMISVAIRLPQADLRRWKLQLKCLRYGHIASLRNFFLLPNKIQFYIGFKVKKWNRFFLSSPNIPLTDDQLRALNELDKFKIFHTHICKQIKATIDAFSLCARRLYMVKDMRIYIGQMIWNTRWEAEDYAADAGAA
ncbi:MAG: hypothetical protein K2Q45_00350 [Nitrosomonas sp.]|nr:hypothetical protein [Nitrosomonas sp.]